MLTRSDFLLTLLSPLIGFLRPGFPPQHSFTHTDIQGRKWEVLWTGNEWGVCEYQWWTNPQFISEQERSYLHPYEFPNEGCESWEIEEYATPREACLDRWEVVRAGMDIWGASSFDVRRSC